MLNQQGKAAIDRVHQGLLKLTNAYLLRNNVLTSNPQLLQWKNEHFEKLKTSLEAPAELSTLQRVTAFKKLLTAINTDENNKMDIHRTDGWQEYARLAYNILSFLTIIPAVARAYSSYSEYGTFRFWRPDSGKAFKGIESEIEEFHQLSIVNRC